jgi:sterol desaturase/sphingolipid hydroxylase (fatty acid hydroxylase superfamily)
MTSALLQIVFCWIYGYILEYSIHRWLLHKVGSKKGRIFSFHFYGHHRFARLNGFFDKSYTGFPVRLDPAGKELLSLLLLFVIHIPVIMYLPWTLPVIVFSLGQYYYVHRKSHNNPEWAKSNLVWHYDHHMGLNQNKNYGVRSDIIDRLVGTRVRYYSE